MTRCLTNHIRPNRRGFTLMEMMVGIAFTVVLFTGVYSFYNVSSQSYTAGVSGATLQDAADTIINKITEGETESGTVYRLGTSVSYLIANGAAGALYTCGGAAQTSPCNTSNTLGELYFCQDSPCATSDATVRWYYLNSAASAVIYHHPNSLGMSTDETIYTAPTGTSLELRFSPASVTTPADAVEVDVAVVKNMAANVTNTFISTTGSASTYILLRGHP